MSEPWPIVPLGEIVRDLEAGVSVNALDEAITMDSDIGVLKVSCVSQGRFLSTKNKKVIPEDVPRVSVSPKRGDIIISRANTFELVGASGYVEQDHPNLFLSDKLWRVILSDSAVDSPRWLIALLNSNKLRREFHRRATGTSGSMKNISKESLLAIKVPRPGKELQAQLGLVFANFEDLSKSLEDEIRAKQTLKRGLMQRLLCGQKRFPEFFQSNDRQLGEFGTVPRDWSVVHISNIAMEVKTRGEVDGSVVYSCTKHDGLVPSLEYFGKQVFSRDLAAYKRLQAGDFAYATNHIEEGSIGLLRKGQPPGLVSPMYTVFRPNNRVNPEYLFALLKTESYRRVFEKRTSASVDRRGSLRWKEFSRIRLGLPSIKEQDRIANTLHLLDIEIDQLGQLYELIESQKRALLTGLLSGELSAPVPA